jgi:hypothetical protein
VLNWWRTRLGTLTVKYELNVEGVDIKIFSVICSKCITIQIQCATSKKNFEKDAPMVSRGKEEIKSMNTGNHSPAGQIL